MSKNQFHKIAISKVGQYYLVPEAELDALLDASQKAFKLQLMPTGDLTFGRLLHVFRRSRKLSFADLADACGVKCRTLKDLENKEVFPRRDNLDKLFKFFGTEFEKQLPEKMLKMRTVKVA